MIRVCFNDAYKSQNANIQDCIEALNRSLESYKTFLAAINTEIEGIFTCDMPSNIKIRKDGGEITLAEIIAGLSREARTYAYSLFTRYPLDNQFEYPDELQDELITEKFVLNIEGQDFDAFNLRVYYHFEGVLLSLGLCPELCISPLVFTRENENTTFELPNLFGTDENATAVAEEINERYLQEADAFTRFLNEIGDHKIEKRVETQFKGYAKVVQDVIIAHFKKAKDRGLQTPFIADGDLVKDVSDGKLRDFQVSELRIFNPIALRIYFSEYQGKVYVASICKKPPQRVQNRDIKSAHVTINKLIEQE